jgi:hypothetical protein
MSYQWGPEGPAFEIQGVYRSENRFLVARAALLGLLALAALTLASADLEFPEWVSSKLTQLPQDKRTPHLLLGLLLLALAGLDLLRASRQRVLRLLPGQPASLVPQARAANATHASAGPLAELVGGGASRPQSPQGGWMPMLHRLAPALKGSPQGLLDWMAQRLAHLLVLAGLVLALALGRLLLAPAGLALVAGLCIAIAVALLLRSAWAARPAPSPRLAGLLVGLALGVGLPVGWATARAPADLGALLLAGGLPLGATLLLASLTVIELLALRAGLTAVDRPLAQGPRQAAASVVIDADADSLQQEVERELHRYWIEGVPNRRYVWQSNLVEHKASGQPFATASLEESQPVIPADQGSAGRHDGGARRPWLLALLLLALPLTLVGGLLWGWVVADQLRRVSPAGTMAAASVLLVLAGGHALRVAHLLWSRIEVESLLLSLACSPTPQPESAGRPATSLHWTVLRARSVFYAAAAHHIGSRMLLRLVPDDEVAQRSAQAVQRFAQKLRPAAGPETGARAAAQPARPTPAARPPAPVAPGLRYCVGCGVSMPASARYCPRCGERQPPG